MNKGVKALLLVFGFGALMLLMFAAVGWWWWSQHGPSFRDESMRAFRDGTAFGKGTDNEGCLRESLENLRRTPEAKGLYHQMFLTTCLPSSRPSKDFCKDVPSAWNQFTMSRWATERCEAERITNPICPGVMSAVPGFCT